MTLARRAIRAAALLAALLSPLAPLAAPAAGAEWRDPTTGAVFVWVPGGRFTLGCGAWAAPCPPNESPTRVVEVKGFWIGKTEVTQGQWSTLMPLDPPKKRMTPDHPVDQVTWEDAHAFLDKLNRAGHGTFRLPSEAEWEYACRERGREIPLCGEGKTDALAWFISNARMSMQPVATKAPNALGLHDMNGNLYEWTEDCWHETLDDLPADGTPQRKGDCASHTLRGGSWGNYPNATRATTRRSDFDVKCPFTGLRLVREGDR